MATRIVLNEVNSTVSTTIKCGETIQIDLEESPTTGYRWGMQASIDGILELENSCYIENHEKAIGQSGLRTFFIIAINPGLTLIHFRLAHPWERGDNWEKQYTLNVESK